MPLEPMISVLYVDDESALLKLGKTFLERHGGFHVDTVPSALEALDLLRTRSYDAIVSDYQMPQMDGIELLKRVRTSANWIPFIIFTGRGREEVVIQALNEGADFYLQKGGEPLSLFTDLAHKIRIAVQQRRAETIIRDHERRESEILDFLPDATFAIDRDGVVIAWNRAMETMTGVASSEIVGRGDYAYALPFYHERRPILIDLVLRDDPATVEKYPFIRKEGDRFFSEITIPHFNNGAGAVLWFTASPLYDTEGRVVGVIESIREITERKRAEDALNASEKRFRDLATLLPQAVYETDAEGYITYTNRMGFSLFGYSETDIERRIHCLELVALCDRERAATSMRASLEGRQSPIREFLGLRKDGSTFPISVSSSPIVENDVIVGIRGILVDISERKQAELTLIESERKYRTIFESTGTANIVIEEDTTISLANSEFERLSGYPRDEIESIKKWTEFIADEDRAMMLAQHYLRREDQQSAQHRYEFRFVTRSGEIRNILLTVDLIPGTTKSIAALLDITDRKRAERDLVVAHDEYTGLLDQIQDVYYRSDLKGTLVKASRSWAELLGYESVEECLGKNIAETFYLDPSDRQRLLDTIDREGKVTHFEVTLKKKDGSPVPVETSSHPNFDQDGNVIGIEGTFSDISERKRQERILRAQLDLSLALQGTIGVREKLMACLDAAIDVSGMESGGVYLVDERTGAIDLAVSRNLSDEFVATSSRYPPDSTNARIVMAGVPIYSCHGEFDDEQNTVQQQEGIRALGVVPIVYEGQVIACLNIGSRAVCEIPPVARIALETIAIQIGVAIGRIRADETLAESELRYRNVVEDQTEFISRFAPDGTHVFVNDAYCRYFGLDRSAILGHRFRPQIHPEDRPRLETFFASLTPDHPVDTIEHRIVMPNGETRWQRWSDRALFDPSGAIMEYQSVGCDITQQKLVEEALRARTEELDNRNRLITTVLDMVPFGIFMVETPTGRPLIANREAARLLGRGVLPDATEENLAEVYEAYRAGTSDRYPSDEMPILRGMRGERCRVDDMVVVRPDGFAVQLEVIGMPVVDANGRVIASLVTFDDITDRKRGEERIRETNTRFNLLTSITRHDVANQVSILRGYAELAAKRAPSPDFIDLMTKIDEAGATIARQIAFTKVYQELRLHDPVWTRIDEILPRALPNGGISLVSSCGPIEVYADPMLERVLFNLIDNAVRHGKRVTRIVVACEENPEGLVLSIRDDGIGVRDDEKERIFEKGYGANSGFGLFLAREILAITGISIVETGVFGEGAEFDLLVPPGMYRLRGHGGD